MAGEELSLSDGMQLMNEENLFLLGAVADNLRRKNSGNIVTFVCSYYLNYTNICAEVVHSVLFIERVQRETRILFPLNNSSQGPE